MSQLNQALEELQESYLHREHVKQIRVRAVSRKMSNNFRIQVDNQICMSSMAAQKLVWRTLTALKQDFR